MQKPSPIFTEIKIARKCKFKQLCVRICSFKIMCQEIVNLLVFNLFAQTLSPPWPWLD